MKTILVCGGRDFLDKGSVVNELDGICEERGWITEPSEDGNYLPSVKIITGGAFGADRLAEDWAIINYCPLQVFPADWKSHGRAAGPRRNAQMLSAGKPDVVMAFPGGRGTADMVAKARAAGVEVIEVAPR